MAGEVLRRQGGAGLWLASGGAALQLVGLSWDALLHSFDPGLAAREDVFSLTNPSHLLVIVGLALTVLGLVWLLLGGWRDAAGAARRGRLLAGLTLGLLFAGMSGLGLATGATFGQHDHGASGGLAGSASGGSNVLNSPVYAQLAQLMRDRGTEAALDRLEEIAAADEGVLAIAHDYAHALGRESIEVYGGAPQAFGRCRETFQSGCYHGVLEGYLEANPQLTTQEIRDLCDATFTPGAAPVVRFQCLHGLGHGLTARVEHDVFRALRLCDALGQEWDRGSCYSGVFMENIIFATQLRSAESGDGHQHDHGAGHRAHLYEEDPLYPCNAVDDRYKPECFVMQTSAILMFNGYDFPGALRECDQAPREFIHLCYQSIGRDVSSYTFRDPQKALQMCLNGQAAYAGYCFLGAAKNMIDVTWKIDQALELCSSAPSDHKQLCYSAIGEQLASLHPDLDERARECERSEREYIRACARGAGISATG